MVSDWPVVPSSTSWWATRPRSRTECTRMPPAAAPPRAPGTTSCSVGSARPVGRGGGHALHRHHGRAGRRVDLLVVVQLDDLGRLEEGRGQLGEAHHQHRADGEVRRDDAVAASVNSVRSSSSSASPRPGRADDRVDAVGRAPAEVVACRLGVVKSTATSAFPSASARWSVGDREASCNKITGMKRVDRRDKLQGGIGGDGFAHRRAHAPSRAEHTDPGRHAPHVTHRRYQITVRHRGRRCIRAPTQPPLPTDPQ